MKGITLRIALATLLAILGIHSAHASRYQTFDLATAPAQVTVGNADAKDLPRFAGLDASAIPQPQVWYRLNTTDTSYSTVALTKPTGSNPTEWHVTGLSDNTNATTAIGNEIVVGWYKEAGFSIPVYWARKDTTTYEIAAKLPAYQRAIPPCDGVRLKIPGSECYDPASPPAATDRCAAENAATLYVPNGDPAQNENPDFVYDCDFEAEANSVSNTGIIVGVSRYYDQDSILRERPVYWIKEIGSNNQVGYLRCYDLGVYRYDGTFLEVNYNPNANTLGRIVHPGRATIINQRGNSDGTSAAFGFVDVNNDGTFKPVIWSNLNSNAHQGPSVLSDDDTLHVETLFPRFAVGWKTIPASSNPPTPSHDVANVISYFGFSVPPDFKIDLPPKQTILPGGDFIPPSFLGENSNHRFYGSNGEEFVGTGEIASGVYTASYASNCGGAWDSGAVEKVSDLLVAPLVSGSLTTALSMKGKSYASTLLARDDSQNFYALGPITYALDVGITVAVERETAHVGERNRYTITLTNHQPVNPSENNWATCVVFTLNDYVYFPENRERSIKQEPGGIDYLSVSPEGTECNITLTQVRCLVRQLKVGEPKTVTITTRPREILTDRTVRTLVTIGAREESVDIPKEIDNLTGTSRNNAMEVYYHVERDACFIATAAYGSLGHEYVNSLRKFRDQVLMQTSPGQWLVKKYYSLSPPIADFIRESDMLRTTVRVALVPPVLLIRHQWLLIFLFISMLLFLRLKSNPAASPARNDHSLADDA